MKKAILTFLTSVSFLIANGQAFYNRSLEYWADPAVCEVNTPPDGWSDYSNVGIGPDEANFLICPTTIPTYAINGYVYARCLAGNPNTGEGMYQVVSGFTIGTRYSITYQYCGSNRWGGNGTCVWHLFIDDVDVNQSAVFSSTDTVWHSNSYTFTATDTAHKIGVRAYTPTYNGGGSAGIDLFMINRAEQPTEIIALDASDISIGPNPFDNTLSLQIAKPFDAEFELLNLTGQIVLKETFTNQITLSTDMLPSAVYFYQIKSKGKVVYQGRVMKK